MSPRSSIVWFIGVSTSGSLIHATAPLWRRPLGRPIEVIGVDVPLGATRNEYRALIGALRDDERAAGAVVTSHKVALFEASSDLFDELDDIAVALGEINAIRRTASGHLAGFARDQISTGLVVDAIWPAGTCAVSLGAGATATALARHLLARPEPPPNLWFVDVRDDAAAHLERCVAADAKRRGVVLQTVVGSGPWDRIIAAAEARSLIVNATGLGKDRPGAPVSLDVTFPTEGVVWDLNYRGDLRFLEAARRQAARQRLHVHDGWSLFCQGWATALSAVLDLADRPRLGDELGKAAESVRPGDSTPPQGR